MAAGLVAACTADRAPTPEASTGTPDPGQWVTVYEPERAWNGYTLAFYAHRIPILLDMNGRIVHRWTEARVKSRLRLLPDGSLLGIALGRGVVEYDWAGNRTWEFSSPIGFAHHDVIRLENGNTVTLIRPDEGRFDVVLEVDRAGEVIWQWNSEEALEPFVPPKGWSKVDITHLNSIQALPANRWFDGGDRRFRPGNYLMSSRELDLVFIVDRPSGAVVWSFGTDLDKQHEPLMTGPDHPRAGHIILFNNRYRSFYQDRQSSILEIDPISKQIVWQFRTAGFYSPTSGVVQPLPNGNLLITSSRGGRTFEIDAGGHVVWEWVPPFDTTRSHRYPPDHAPQLATLEAPAAPAIRPSPGYRHVDTDVYRFARRGLRRKMRIAGETREILKYSNDCRRMVIPDSAVLEVGYGVDWSRVPASDASSAVRFELSLRPLDGGSPVELITDRLDPTMEPWSARTVPLSENALRPVELCLQAGWEGQTATEIGAVAFWQQPVIRTTSDDTEQMTEEDLGLDELTAEELETRRKHLEALGYVN